MDVAEPHVRIGGKRQMQRRRGRHAFDLEFAKRANEALDRRLARDVPDDQLAEKRIVERRHRIAGIKHRIETHAHAAGHGQSRDRARCRQKPWRDLRH